MLLRALPLNPHGKVNSSALPAPLPERSKSDGSVLGAFREILGNPRYSNADSFFDAGGSSLLAARLIVSLRDLTGVQPPLELFAEPRTAEHIASYLAGQSGSGQTSRGGKATAEAV